MWLALTSAWPIHSGKRGVEVLIAARGKKQGAGRKCSSDKTVSRISKFALFALFKIIAKALVQSNDLVTAAETTYSEAKSACSTYQKRKTKSCEAFHASTNG